ncbi:MAG TPA: hypothetical protein PLC48_04965 [Ferruginibacter sp.]|nr:hypothetical protein [Ferruginibacter sp.]
MEAQLQTDSITGAYYLKGVMETASGFKLNADSTFEFFFSYGALDREGSGTWEQKDNRIIFNSPVVKGQPFALMAKKTLNSPFTTIKINDPNVILAHSVFCRLSSGQKTLEEMSNQKGEIIFDRTTVDSILLVSEFCPEKAAVFAFSNKEENYFEFRFESWWTEVFFDHLAMKLENNELIGQHPLLKEGEYHFTKH